ncbi:MAG: response regulator [Bacteroidetes bacterium]|nr:MAG: response regulator [Bacteroidota bacterium]
MKRYLKIAIISFLFIAIGSNLFAQKGNLQAWVIDSIYEKITKRLEQPGGDTARYFILQQVRSHCGTDDHCQYDTYYKIMKKLEQRYNLPMAIFVGEELVKVAQRQGNLREEANAYPNLYRYHDALGNHRLAFKNSEKALSLFKQLGDSAEIAYTQMAMLESSLNSRKLEEVLPEMEALLDQTVTNGDTSVVSHIHIRLILIYKKAGMYVKMEEHVAALEKIPVSDPIKTSEYTRAIYTARGRADLLKVRGKLTEAELFYQKALRLCEDQPNRWLEIKILNNLSDLEWKRGNVLAAKSYLNKAQQKAEDLENDELLASIFESQARIAEAERRYADALEFTKKHHFHDNKLKSQSEEFNVESYYLQQEKEQLATEKENQELELQIKKTQLRNSLLMSALVILLTFGLFVGMQRQRKAKQELAAQNTLIQQQAEELKSLDAAKSHFFANVSHELRTPLTLMLGPIKSVLKGSHSPEQQKKLLNTALRSGQQLQQLVNEILDLRKLEMGKMDVQAEPTLLSAFFNTYATQFESLAQSRHIDFSHETTLPVDAAANIDREKCRQILSNLLSNALKFTPAGGWVRVHCSLQGNNLHLNVADSGSGIPPEDLPRVFDRYFQSSRPERPAEGGTGIGLALCQEYARLFGGDISVESTLGKGSAFRVEFPVTLADAGQISQAWEASEATPAEAFGMTSGVSPAGQSAHKPAILVVEDNPELLDYIRLVLEEKYHVVTAGNGQEALDRPWLTDNCQLIISDLMMPVMDGYQLLERLKSDDATRHIPVIMLTARAEAHDRLTALRLGVDDYLTKPFDEEELLVRIDNLLKNQAARQQEVAAESGQEASPPVISQLDRQWLETFEAYLQKYITSDILSISLLTQEFAMSESTLLRQLKRLTGLTPMQYLTEVRLNEARRLLENRVCRSMNEVAARVGYSEARTLARNFRARFGKLPSDWLEA